MKARVALAKANIKVIQLNWGCEAVAKCDIKTVYWVKLTKEGKIIWLVFAFLDSDEAFLSSFEQSPPHELAFEACKRPQPA